MTPPSYTDFELRTNHEFVIAFETIRKEHGHREMHDMALREIADATGVAYETLRISRHLRNALAHGEVVNRDNLERHLGILRQVLRTEEPGPSPAYQDDGDSDPVQAYRVHAWKDPRLEKEMLANGFVSIGGSEIGDLTGVDDPEIIRAWLTESMPDHTRRAISLFVGYWRRFLEAEAGDLVVLPTRDRRVSIGEFVGPYHYVVDADPRARHRRPVSWIKLSVERDVFDPDLISVLNGQHTVQDFKAPDAVARLRRISRTAHSTGDFATDADWDHVREEMQRRAQWLTAAGWNHIGTDSDHSWEYGNSLFWDLERDGVVIQLEFYDHGQLVAYPVSEKAQDDDLAEPYFSIHRSTVESSREAFEAKGWL